MVFVIVFCNGCLGDFSLDFDKFRLFFGVVWISLWIFCGIDFYFVCICGFFFRLIILDFNKFI